MRFNRFQAAKHLAVAGLLAVAFLALTGCSADDVLNLSSGPPNYVLTAAPTGSVPAGVTIQHSANVMHISVDTEDFSVYASDASSGGTSTTLTVTGSCAGSVFIENITLYSATPDGSAFSATGWSATSGDATYGSLNYSYNGAGTTTLDGITPRASSISVASLSCT